MLAILCFFSVSVVSVICLILCVEFENFSMFSTLNKQLTYFPSTIQNRFFCCKAIQVRSQKPIYFLALVKKYTCRLFSKLVICKGSPVIFIHKEDVRFPTHESRNGFFIDRVSIPKVSEL